MPDRPGDGEIEAGGKSMTTTSAPVARQKEREMSEENTRVISRDQADEWELACGVTPGERHRERIDEHRWYSVWLVVFQAPDDGKTWGATYLRPLSESQEVDRWDDAKEITLTLMESYEKTVTVWRAVADAGL